jgi:uncharacterized protein (TIGR02186 family)
MPLRARHAACRTGLSPPRFAAPVLLFVLAMALAGTAAAQAPDAAAAVEREAEATRSPPCDVRGDSILADLSTHTVTIDARFAGEAVLVFGAIECIGDIIVTLRGPRRSITVREKEEVAGVWVHGGSVRFADAPILYAVASTAPVERVLPEGVRKARGIGLDALELPVERPGRPEVARFRAAFIATQQEAGLYTGEPLPIAITGQKLFRASIWLPATVPPGQYIADVYLVRDGGVIGAHSMGLSVYRGGFEARLFDFAHEQPALYGAAAIVVAAFMGWVVGTLFRRP